MNIQSFFEPVEVEFLFDNEQNLNKKRYIDITDIHTQNEGFPSLDKSQIVLFGVGEDRACIKNKGCAKASQNIREEFYQLFPENTKVKIADLGNMKRGYEAGDTYFALSLVVEELMKKNIVPIILGGSQDLTFANYLAYENMSRIVNLLSIDSHLNIGYGENDLNSENYLSHIIMKQPNYLFNFTNIAYQTYLNDNEGIKILKKLLFDSLRLGDLRSDFKEAEPLLRNADILSVDIAAIKHSEAPAQNFASPNGLYSEEACKLLHYAGLSDKLSSLGFYEYNPALDIKNQTAKLIAQMIWYFIEGFSYRPQDFPLKEEDNFIKYTVDIQGHDENIVFFKSKRSERWWMEVKCPTDLKEKYDRQYIIPCSEKDYETACANEIPDRWWQSYQKMM